MFCFPFHIINIEQQYKRSEKPTQFSKNDTKSVSLARRFSDVSVAVLVAGFRRGRIRRGKAPSWISHSSDLHNSVITSGVWFSISQSLSSKIDVYALLMRSMV